MNVLSVTELDHPMQCTWCRAEASVVITRQSDRTNETYSDPACTACAAAWQPVAISILAKPSACDELEGGSAIVETVGCVAIVSCTTQDAAWQIGRLASGLQTYSRQIYGTLEAARRMAQALGLGAGQWRSLGQ